VSTLTIHLKNLKVLDSGLNGVVVIGGIAVDTVISPRE